MMQIYQIQFRALGCEVVVQVASEKDMQPVLGQVPATLEAYENVLSRFRPNSELMRLNAQAGTWFAASSTLFENIQAAKQAARLTNGHFNPLILPALVANGYDRSFETLTEPVIQQNIFPALDWHCIELDIPQQRIRIPQQSALDLGGIAKGWIAARLADNLAIHGAVLVNLGGDIALRGMPSAENSWLVDVADPFSGTASATVALTDTHIVTSGLDFRHWQTRSGENRHHIINPFTGQSAVTDVLTATVIHPHAPTAEAFAKTLILLGAEKGLHWLSQQWQGAALIIMQDGAILADARFSDFMIERSNS